MPMPLRDPNVLDIVERNSQLVTKTLYAAGDYTAQLPLQSGPHLTSNQYAD
jgi:hypothetical protein